MVDNSHRRDRDPKMFRIDRMLSKARERAKAAGIAFRLKRADVEAVWPPNDRCPILGIRFANLRKRRKQGVQSSPSLDRINPRLGYVPGNVLVMSYRANTLKNDETDPAIFRRIADWLEARQKIFAMFD